MNWTLGAPRNGGYLDWDYEDGEVTPMLSGYLYLTDQECGRVHVEYYDDDHDLIDDRDSGTYCAPGNGKTQWWVVIDGFSDPDIDHVHVELEDQVGGGYAYVDGTDEDFD